MTFQKGRLKVGNKSIFSIIRLVCVSQLYGDVIGVSTSVTSQGTGMVWLTTPTHLTQNLLGNKAKVCTQLTPNKCSLLQTETMPSNPDGRKLMK